MKKIILIALTCCVSVWADQITLDPGNSATITPGQETTTVTCRDRSGNVLVYPGNYTQIGGTATLTISNVVYSGSNVQSLTVSDNYNYVLACTFITCTLSSVTLTIVDPNHVIYNGVDFTRNS